MTMMPYNRNKETCECTGCCRYPNGPIPLILAQIIMFLGAIFSIEAMFDCRFVDAVIASILIPGYLENYLPAGGRRGLGFFFWELENGECSWDLEDDLTDELMEDYIDFLGWRTPRGMGMTALVLSCIIWIWLLVFSCVAHLRPMRYLLSALCLLILVVFQSVTFAVMNSDVCDGADCKMDRGAWFAIAAVFCFFFSGLLFLVTKDHPGDADAYVITAAAAAPAATGKGAGAQEEHDHTDTEEHTAEHVDDDQPTEQVLDKQVLNDGITDAQEIVYAQEIEAPSNPFVDNSTASIKA
jgi:hypothetical protein